MKKWFYNILANRMLREKLRFTNKNFWFLARTNAHNNIDVAVNVYKGVIDDILAELEDNQAKQELLVFLSTAQPILKRYAPILKRHILEGAELINAHNRKIMESDFGKGLVEEVTDIIKDLNR